MTYDLGRLSRQGYGDEKRRIRPSKRSGAGGRAGGGHYGGRMAPKSGAPPGEWRAGIWCSTSPKGCTGWTQAQMPALGRYNSYTFSMRS